MRTCTVCLVRLDYLVGQVFSLTNIEDPSGPFLLDRVSLAGPLELRGTSFAKKCRCAARAGPSWDSSICTNVLALVKLSALQPNNPPARKRSNASRADMPHRKPLCSPRRLHVPVSCALRKHHLSGGIPISIFLPILSVLIMTVLRCVALLLATNMCGC